MTVWKLQGDKDFFNVVRKHNAFRILPSLPGAAAYQGLGRPSRRGAAKASSNPGNAQRPLRSLRLFYPRGDGRDSTAAQRQSCRLTRRQKPPRIDRGGFCYRRFAQRVYESGSVTMPPALTLVLVFMALFGFRVGGEPLGCGVHLYHHCLSPGGLTASAFFSR